MDADKTDIPENPEQPFRPDGFRSTALSEAVKLGGTINDASQVLNNARLFEAYLRESD